jgi:hypothetical protein
MKPIWFIDRHAFPYSYAFVPDEAAWRAAVKTITQGKGTIAYPEFKCASARHLGLKNWPGHDDCSLVAISPDIHKKGASIVVGLLIHEAVHVWRYMKKCVGEDKPACEQEAYAIQRISQDLIYGYQTTRGRLYR